MVASVLRRKTRVTERARWESQLATVMPRIKSVLEKSTGFISVQYAWDVYSEGTFAQITSWRTEEDCQRYLREGAAATVATIEESALPTAPHPEGAWVRHTYEIVEA
jgi:heme-degrading monooxygenase HmoA